MALESFVDGTQSAANLNNQEAQTQIKQAI
jgi:hypothetical protein